uniref:Solute carrier family 38 member 5 n=1 Tax=Chrysemys picta bellii TaxID=8478 RepID=A0A8C3H8Y0_CHRPI
LPLPSQSQGENPGVLFEGKTSFGMSVFNLSNAIMGSGILGLAYAMSNTGINPGVLAPSPPCSNPLAPSPRPEPGRGPRRPDAGVCFAAMSSYLYIVKYELPLVIQTFLAMEKKLSNSIGLLVGPVEGSNLPPPRVTWGRSSLPFPPQTAYTIPILAFAFVCHPEVLPIYTELPSRRRMQSVANVSILAMFIMYLLTAIFGYLTFYGNVEPEMLHTYSEVDPLDRLILCVRLAVLMAVTLTVPVVLFPIRRAIQQLLFHGKDFSWVRHVSIAICLLFLVNLLVIFVPNIRDIFGVIGATSAPSLIFILPSIFYLRIVPNEKEPLRSKPKIQVPTAGGGVQPPPISAGVPPHDWGGGSAR